MVSKDQLFRNVIAEDVSLSLSVLLLLLQKKGEEELEEVLGTVTDSMETAASTPGDPEGPRQGLLRRMEQIAQSLRLVSSQANGGDGSGPQPSGAGTLPSSSSSRDEEEGEESHHN